MPRLAVSDEKVDWSVLEGRAPSVGALLRGRVEATPDKPAFQYFADPESAELTTVTWAEAYDLVEALAAGLMELDVGLEDRVALASQTRYEWVIADLAIVCARGSTRVPVMSERSITRSSSAMAWPATAWPPPLMAGCSSCSRPKRTAAITSATPVQRAIRAGRRWIWPFQTWRALS